MSLKFIKNKLFVFALLPLVFVCMSSRNLQPDSHGDPGRSPSNNSITVTKVIVAGKDTFKMDFLNNSSVFTEGWDSLAQPQFWKQIMCLSPDSCIINVARTRMPLQTACYRTWCSQSEFEKTSLKKRLRDEFCIDYTDELYVTNGKREFYEHRKSLSSIGTAVRYFLEYGTDPWYAQTILLIESPGKHTSRSYAGAAGPFQLMPSVAIRAGLKVNRHVDERTNMKRAAYGASRLLSTICIPKVKDMLNTRNISYTETDIWFRLLVLHAYHAGPGNLAAAINKINPSSGGQDLIRRLWETEAKGFKNESQNYSQIALAAIMNFEDILHLDGDTVYSSYGDKTRADNLRNKSTKTDNEAWIYSLLMYERDLADGTIAFDYFREVVSNIRKELQPFSVREENNNAYPLNEEQLVRLSGELIRKRKFDDAIQLLRFNMEFYPDSPVTAEMLAKAYRITGKTTLAQHYLNMAAKSNGKPAGD